MLKKWEREGLLDHYLPEVEALRGVPQSPEYHAEGDAFIHTMLAVDAVDPDLDERVFWGVLLHDIGKKETTAMVDGKLRSFGHAEEGARLVPSILARLGRSDLAADVSWLVQNHTFHFSWNVVPGMRLSNRQKRFMDQPLFPLLLKVCAADAAGSHGHPDKGEAIATLLHIRQSLQA